MVSRQKQLSPSTGGYLFIVLVIVLFIFHIQCVWLIVLAACYEQRLNSTGYHGRLVSNTSKVGLHYIHT